MLDGRCDRLAVHPWHFVVSDNYINMVCSRKLNTLFSTIGGENLESRAGKHGAIELKPKLVIIDPQQSGTA
ncbi:MAG TPA: hypothetical protein VFA90_06655 [Terriglobales bacterium]|nr:hypothetical protein [Terriglobales bacterium]